MTAAGGIIVKRGGYKMKIFDISMTIEPDMPLYKGRSSEKPKLETINTHEEDGAHKTKISMTLHTGTHLDAPLHMIKEGADLHYLDNKQLIAPCQVIDVSHLDEKISAKEIKDLQVEDDEFILFKTKNSEPGYLHQFPKKFIYLDKSAAKLLAEKNPAGVGIDALGIERNQPEHKTHKLLLENEIIIIEGLRLNEIKPGRYTLILAPLKLKNYEGAPARALLIDGEISTADDLSN